MSALDSMRTPKVYQSDPIRVFRVVLICVAFLPFAYKGAYFALIALPDGSLQVPPFPTNPPNDIQIRYVSINGEWTRYPNYRGLPARFFSYLHDYDRTHLRPDFWSGYYPRNQELSFDWLLGPNPHHGQVQ